MKRIISFVLSMVIGVSSCLFADGDSHNAQAVENKAAVTEIKEISKPSAVTEATTKAVEEATTLESKVKAAPEKPEVTTEKTDEITTEKAETTTEKSETKTKKAETTKEKTTEAEKTTKATTTNSEKPANTKRKSENYIWPASKDAIITAGYPYYSNGCAHNGVDIALYDSNGTNVARNSVILATREGVVVTVYNDGKWNDGYGNYCIIDHGNGVQTLYAHANEICVSQGDTVRQGQVIGLIGDTGNTTAPHLHFEVRVERNSGYVRTNPLKFISEP